MRLVVFFILCLCCLGVQSSSSTESKEKEKEKDRRLWFNEQGKFKIVQFTDLHYGENQYENQQTALVQDAILAAEKPDLVIITGDLVSGYEWAGKGGGGWFESLWRQLVAPMIKHNIRWAVALGNHDVEGDLSGASIVDLDSSHDLSLTQMGPRSIGGATNYYLPIYKYNSTDIGQILWVLDSGSNACLGVSGWGCVQYDQVAWYRNESLTLKYAHNRVIPSLAFFHIPLYEHLDLWNVRGVKGDLAEGDGVCCSSVNTGLYATMKELGDVAGVYCGHDHSNDYIGDYHGITLGFGRKTGYGCYGPPWGWKHGARVLEVTQNEFGAKTWLRLEDGSVEHQKQNPVSIRKFLGCCSMEGHGRAMGWMGMLLAGFVNIAAVGLCAIAVIWAVKRYRKNRVRLYDVLVAEDEEDTGSNDATAPALRGARLSTPIPRQRRSILMA